MAPRKQDWSPVYRFHRRGWLTPLHFDVMADYDRSRGGDLRRWVEAGLDEAGRLQDGELALVAHQAARTYAEEAGGDPTYRRLTKRNWKEFLLALARIVVDRRRRVREG